MDSYIQYAVNGATRMQARIDDLPAYSRVNSRTEPVQKTESQAILNNALTNLKAMIQESGALVTSDALPEIDVDAAQFERVFQSLTVNAVKFRGESPSRVHVSVNHTRTNGSFAYRITASAWIPAPEILIKEKQR
ncbi:MAG: hypothetical protein GY801_39225 [bacterium]|nr:hypothetical protein [bacterium]